jgi:hypothetical protein
MIDLLATALEDYALRMMISDELEARVGIEATNQGFADLCPKTSSAFLFSD